MKRLSDYKGDEAIELWGDLIEPLTKILTDKNIANVVQNGASKIIIAKELLKTHKEELVDILIRIDPTPVDGLNILLRVINLLGEIGENEEIKSFFGYVEPEKTEDVSSGSAMENTTVGEN